jgi:hypothetical protein
VVTKEKTALAGAAWGLIGADKMQDTKITPEDQALPVTFTVFTSTAILSKRYNLDASDNIVKTPAAQMTSGTAQRITMDFSEFRKALADADERTAFGYGLHDEAFGEKVKITVKGKENESKGILSRSQKYLQYRPRPGILMNDHDPHPRGPAVTPDELQEILAGILPGFADAASWVRASLSADVHRPGEQPQSGKGFHIYNAVTDASDIPRFGEVLSKRMWLAGYGYIAISAAGTFLVRSILDAAVCGSERLDFTGRPVVGEGLAWTPPEATYKPGGYLDTRLLPDLSADEEWKFNELVAEAKRQAEPERAAIRAVWMEKQVKRMVERGIPEERARQTIRYIGKDGARFDLYQDFVLDFANEGAISVGEVLKNPGKYNGKACADPFEGQDYGRTTAKFYNNLKTGSPCINSNAHGGMIYYLHDIPEPTVCLCTPVPFEEFSVPPIPAKILPSWAGDFAESVAEAIQVPDELVVSNVIGVVSAAVSHRFVIEVKPRYREPLNLYELCALEPGERKSATLAACSKPLESWEEAKVRALSEEIRRAVSEVKTLEKTVERMRNLAARAKTSEDRQSLIKDIQELEETMPKIPAPPRLIADDITPERAAGLLAENDERIAILSAEGGIFDILAGRYSNGVPNLDLFLKGHSGDSVRVDRKTGVPVILQSPAITMCLSPQPEVIRGLASKPGFRGRGLLGRFLYYMPQSRLGYRSTEAAPVDQATLEKYRRNIEALLDYPWSVNIYGEKIPHVLKLSPGAFAAWKEFAGLVERELRDGGQFEAMRDWAGKLPGTAARLAGILHLVKHAGDANIPLTVDADVMNSALEMATLLSVHAKAAFGLMGTDLEIEAATHILAWIKRDRLDTFTGRDCHRAVRGKYPKMAQVSPGLKILEERGFIFPADGDREGPGRPKSPSYTVNPNALEEVTS